jgi:hypothetical protein
MDIVSLIIVQRALLRNLSIGPDSRPEDFAGNPEKSLGIIDWLKPVYTLKTLPSIT